MDVASVVVAVASDAEEDSLVAVAAASDVAAILPSAATVPTPITYITQYGTLTALARI